MNIPDEIVGPSQKLTPEQIRVLAGFAQNMITGRRVLCMVAHFLFVLGTVAVALATFGDHFLNIWNKGLR